jgi:hypothetical protein
MTRESSRGEWAMNEMTSGDTCRGVLDIRRFDCHPKQLIVVTLVQHALALATIDRRRSHLVECLYDYGIMFAVDGSEMAHAIFLSRPSSAIR